MSVRFPPSLILIDGLWSAFKTQVAARGLNSVVQYDEDETVYTIWAVEGDLCFNCQIWKGAVPTGGYTQIQNDADKADFEANFKPYSNRSVDDIPSFIVANSIKQVGGGGSNLNQNGSVTPVVFEYNPPNNFDIELTALSLLFEDTGAFAFGNKFILSTLNTLTNGLLLDVKAGDVAFTWQNMRRTRDIIEVCSDFSIVTGTTNFMRVKIHLPATLRLSRAGTFATADYIRLTVRDDLSSLDFAEAHFQGVKL